MSDSESSQPGVEFSREVLEYFFQSKREERARVVVVSNSVVIATLGVGSSTLAETATTWNPWLAIAACFAAAALLFSLRALVSVLTTFEPKHVVEDSLMSQVRWVTTLSNRVKLKAREEIPEPLASIRDELAEMTPEQILNERVREIWAITIVNSQASSIQRFGTCGAAGIACP